MQSVTNPMRAFRKDPSIIGVLGKRAEHQPEERAFVFLHDRGKREEALSYAQLDEWARMVGGYLQRQGSPGDRVALFFPPGLEFIAAFFGCLYAGMAAVPLYPPRPGQKRFQVDGIIANCRPDVALTADGIHGQIGEFLARESVWRGRVVSLSEITRDHAAGWRFPRIDEKTLALLQYTSGSTAEPKGVMVTHGNLEANLRVIAEAFRIKEGDIGCNWLPVYHDMGLIGTVLQPIYSGILSVLMPSVAFIQDSMGWLEAISRTKATICGGPNFAFEHCVRKANEKAIEGLDLSGWRLAFTGAEPVRAGTLEKFAETFAPAGFKRAALYPCYGMAEATLFVSGGVLGDPVPVFRAASQALSRNLAVPAPATESHPLSLVGCGAAFPGHQIVIANPETRTGLAPHEIGEIWVKGPSIAAGYWDRPGPTETGFRGFLADGRGPFLRTGDLGFLKEGSLYITGRLKDLMVIRGRNHYPQDVERTASRSHPALRPDFAAAFSVERFNEERLVVVGEVERRAIRDLNADEVAAAIRGSVSAEHELRCDAVVLVKPGAIPKTSSGKLKRYACRAQFLAGTLATVAQDRLEESDFSQPSPALDPNQFENAESAAVENLVRSHLHRLIRSRLNSNAPGLDERQALTGLGLDSISLIELGHRVETDFGVRLPVESLYRNRGLADLIGEISREIVGNGGIRGHSHSETAEPAFETPLSHNQRALWFLNRWAPESSAYHLTYAFTLRGPVDRSLLQTCFRTLVARHAALRTRFCERVRQVVQRVEETDPFMVQTVDAGTWSLAGIGEFLDREACRPFDLNRGPLLRILLLETGSGEPVLFFSVHHIVADFWSLTILAGELRLLYSGDESRLPAVRRNYSGYVADQARYLKSEAGHRDLAYWQRQLGTSVPNLDLPYDKPRPRLQTFNGAAHSFEIDAGLRNRVTRLAEWSETTPFCVLLAAFQGLLHCYSGQDEVWIGSPSSGRTRSENRGLVGFLVNTLVMRGRLAGDSDFRRLLRHTKSTVEAAMAHQDLPFQYLVEKLQPERDPSRPPLFQTMFAYQKTPGPEGLAPFVVGRDDARLQLGTLVLETFPLPNPRAQFELSLFVAPLESGFGGIFEYNRDLFKAETVRRLAGHFVKFLEAVVTRPDLRLGAVPLMDEAERRRILGEWSRGKPVLGETCLDSRFETVVARKPHAVALSAQPRASGRSEQLDYRCFQRMVTGVAARLHAHAVGPESIVAMFMPRGAAMAAAVLGTYRVGGVCLPLDPDYPRARLAFMVADARPAVILTVKALVSRLPQTRTPILETDARDLAVPVETSRPLTIDADHLAYLIFTSGSTGQPKGAGITRGTLANLAAWQHGESAGALKTLWFAALSFDVAFQELFATLCFGGTLVWVTAGQKRDPARVLRLLAEEGVERLFLPFVALQQLASEAERGPLKPKALREIVTAGEPLRWTASVSAFVGGLPRARLVNQYGPSESHVVTAYRVPSRNLAYLPPIGRPLPQAGTFVLNPRLLPVPAGICGELFLADPVLARGYYRRPRLTAEKFIPNPFANRAGDRLYKTGDTARFRHDGNIAFLGRRDRQVKLSGYRLELGEIEVALCRHEAVKDAVVVVRETGADGRRANGRLIAYIVPKRSSDAVSSADWRAFLRERLPGYMVPSGFAVLDGFPLTPSGKVDRAALSRRTVPVADAGTGMRKEPARTRTERELAEIWSALLECEVGRDDRFFDLGGHSLLAAQMSARVNERLGVRLPVSAVFETPALGELSGRIDRLRQSAPQPAVSPIPVRPEPVDTVLTRAQERLWFLEKLGAQPGAYHLPVNLRLKGALHVKALERAFQAVLERHGILRSAFFEVEGRPMQRVRSTGGLRLSVVDLTAVRDGEELAGILACRSAAAPFDLGRGPLLRAMVVRRSKRDHHLLVTLHHIGADGWSIGILAGELNRLYRHAAGGDPGSENCLPPLSLQFADYARWQRRQPVDGESLEYWRRHLSGAPRHHGIPVRSMNGNGEQTGNLAHFQLDSQVTHAIADLGREADATEFMTFLAAFAVLVSHASNREAMVIGTPFGQRSPAQTETLIGFFVNTLALHLDLSGDPGFLEFLRRVRTVAVNGFAHGHVPFEQVVEAVAPERRSGRSPIFQLFFSLQEDPLRQFGLPGLETHAVAPKRLPPKFELSLYLTPGPDGVSGYFEFDSPRYDSNTVERLIRRYQSILAELAANPRQPLSRLSLVTPEERRQLLHDWNRTETDYGDSGLVHPRIEARARSAPDGIALTFGLSTNRPTRHLSHGTLNRRADGLAEVLGRFGSGPESTVGLRIERGPDMVIGLLGILKSGAAYLPLEPELPAARLSFMLADAEVRLLATARDLPLPEALPEAQFLPLYLRDGCAQPVDEERQPAPKTSFQSKPIPQSPAYVIYTSGSTGKPKGVAVGHRAIANRLLWMQAAYGLRAGDRVLQKTPFGFDVSVWEFFWTLQYGALLVVAAPGGHRDPRYLAGLIERERVGFVHFVPSMLQAFLAGAGASVGSRLKKVFCSGEALDRALQQRFFELLAGVELHNLYGPTEAAVDVSFWQCVEGGGGTVPIGKPIANMRLHILDRFGRPTPPGVPAELHIGGVGLARGYLNRPGLTAVNFLPDHLGARPGGRLYRTGDRAKYLVDGAIAFLGRFDRQVKLRGFRIELGEIDAALTRLPGIEAAATLLREDRPGDQRLVAYLVESGKKPAELQDPPNQLPLEATTRYRERLAQSLPDPMIPSVFVVLDAFPVTANGKLDRKALPAPLAGPGSEAHSPPRDPVEAVLCSIFCKLLQRQRVGVNESFFALGGHSLLALQVISSVRDAFSLELPLRAVFDTPTVAGLTDLIGKGLQRPDNLNRGARIEEKAPDEKTLAEVGIPLTPAQERLWFLARLDGPNPVYNMATALRLTGRLSVQALDHGLNLVLARHQALRAVVRDSETGPPRQLVRTHAARALTTVDLSGLDPESGARTARVLIEADAVRAIDLSQGPPCRFALLRLFPDTHVFMVNIHHMMADGWSTAILERELAAAYRDFVSNRRRFYLGSPPSYAAVITRLVAEADRVDFEEQLHYWKRRLADAPPLSTLPGDRARPPRQKFHGAELHFEPDDALAHGFARLGVRFGVTPFMILHAGLAAVLSRYSGQDDVTIGIPVAQRDDPRSASVIGFLVNTLVLRHVFEADAAFDAVLGQVRQTALEAFANRDLPFERVVEALQPERRLAHSPLFQVMFAFRNKPRQPAFPGLISRREAPGHVAAKFDLTLTVEENEGRFHGHWEYDTDLYNPTTIARFSRHFHRLLERAVRDPGGSLSRIALLDRVERFQLLTEWNGIGAEALPGVFVHRLVAERAGRCRDSIAVCEPGSGDGRRPSYLSYAALNFRADRLASGLRGLGAGPEVAVGVCTEASRLAVTAMAAIFKAGAVYLPLDPEYPAERLRTMVEDSGARLAIAGRSSRNAVRGLGVEVLEPDLSQVANLHPEPGAAAVDGFHAAYLIYTSGSTGKPKGVAVSHRSLAHSVSARFSIYSRPERFLLLSSLSFDSSLAGLWWTLCEGGCLVLVSKDRQSDPAGIAETVRDHWITHTLTVPSLLLLLRNHQALLRSLRVAVAAGEACPERLGPLGNARLYNEYGPTETAIWTSMAPVLPGERPSIGRPIPRARLYVLDREYRPVPIGVDGELHIGGTGTARGYHRRPALTACRFQPDPFGEANGGRLYRSGDRARFWADGRIEFLGRIDGQVKLRGFRIEFGEIEAALAAHPSVSLCAAVLRGQGSGSPRIEAFVQSGEGAYPGDAEKRAHRALGEEIREHLSERLPRHMLPSRIAVLAALPRHPNGKVDRGALAALSEKEIHLPKEVGVSPRNPVEAALVSIWADVLGVRGFGVHANFFELGGHSLLANRVSARIRDSFSVDLPLTDFFETPTVAGLAQRVGHAQRSLPARAIPRLGEGEPAPLSFAQLRLWFLNQVEATRAAYHLPAALNMSGNPDIGALAWSLREITRRQQAMRTGFPAIDGKPEQRLLPCRDLVLPLVDFSGLSREAGERESARLAKREARLCFDLENGPLYRFRMLRLTARSHILTVTLHHIVADGWSVGLLIEELAVFYAWRVLGSGPEHLPPSLPSLSVRYGDYAAWQQRHLGQPSIRKHSGYWKRRLDGAPALLELPTDRPRPPIQTFNGGRLRFAIPDSAAIAAKRLCLGEGLTVFMVFQSVFALLLARYSGQDDVVLGTPVANRDRRELEPLIGLFVNTVVLRNRVGGNLRFRALLAETREKTLADLAHRDLPFELVVDALQPERNLSHGPVFQVMFMVQNAPIGKLSLPGLAIQQNDVDPGAAKFDLTLCLVEEEGSFIQGVFEFNTDLFETATMARMARHFQVLSASALNRPDLRLGDLSMLHASERHQLLGEWNRTPAPVSAFQCLHREFEAQARRTPDATAVGLAKGYRPSESGIAESGQTALSYRELDEWASRLARRLRALGVGPNVLVGIRLERSLEMVAGLFAILKAGGAYLPLDPAYPSERLAFMLRDSGAPVLLADSSARQPLSPESMVRVVSPVLEKGNGPENRDQPMPQPAGEHLVYVIYTSGSTGRPKGAAVFHRGFANLVRWFIRDFQLSGGDRMLLTSSLSFDLTQKNIYAPLVLGGTLYLARPEPYDPDHIVAAVREHEITWLNCTPSAFYPLVDETVPHSASGLTSLRLVFLGGEPISMKRLSPWLTSPGTRARIVNTYGPTECTDICAFHAAGEPGRARNRPVPIGRPIHHARLYVLDRHLQPVPVCVAGELAVSGAGVGSGYLNDFALTARRFLPDPNSELPGQRLYRTGDLVRFLPSGEIEFVGRLDHQVKLRGFRIELGEIEAALAKSPHVREAAVMVRRDRPGIERLVAYVQVVSPGEEEGGGEAATEGERLTPHLRELLERDLPEFMVPAVFMFLERFPLTPSGKVDRNALPKPDDARPRLEAPFAPPETETERAIAAIWKHSLGLAEIGVHDSFFDLGGNSLLLVGVHAKIVRELGKSFSIVALFQYPTIRGLATHLNESSHRQPQLNVTSDEARARHRARIQRQKQRKREHRAAINT